MFTWGFGTSLIANVLESKLLSDQEPQEIDDGEGDIEVDVGGEHGLRLITKRLSAKLVRDFDTDGSKSLSRTEFLHGVLVTSGVVDKSLLDDVNSEYDRILDETKGDRSETRHRRPKGEILFEDTEGVLVSTAKETKSTWFKIHHESMLPADNSGGGGR